MITINKAACSIMFFALFTLVVCLPAFGTEDKEPITEVTLTPIEISDSQEPLFENLLNNYRSTHQEIIGELDQAKKNVLEIAKTIQEIKKTDSLIAKSIKKNDTPEYQKKLEEKSSTLWRTLLEKYGTAMILPVIHFQNFNIETEPQQKIEKVLNDTISIYQNTLGCFDQKTYSKLKSCENFRKLCRHFGSENGDMYYYELTKDLELVKIDVSENDTILSSGPWNDYVQTTDTKDRDPINGEDLLQKDTYQFCRLLTLTSDPFLPASIRKEPEVNSKFFAGFYRNVGSFTFQKICIDDKPDEQLVNRLIDLKSIFPENWTIKKYSETYEKWESACNKTAQQICKNTYVVKDQIILTYRTVACENREVTKDDIENDIREFYSNADKLKHSTLSDEIDTCQKAHDNGFFWAYQQPTISDKCKKEPPKRPKSRK